MAHQRHPSTAPGGTHALSLKVLRLSKPSLATQTPLPPTTFGNGLDIAPAASLAYPGADASSTFPLTPSLTLPPAFGAAYVGETFGCTLCANNEVGEEEVYLGGRRSVSAVRMSAELQTPSNSEGITLELVNAEEGEEELGEVAPGRTLQRTLRHELKEEGQHVLAVTVTYTETLERAGSAVEAKARTFRKLYQFSAQQLIAVRSKVTERKRREREGLRQWILEAQLENVGETSVVLEKLWLNEREGIASSALNGEGRDATVLKPQDVEQVMFVLREEEQSEDVAVRIPLAQLNIDWRSALGEKGSLTTGWLASRGR